MTMNNVGDTVRGGAVKIKTKTCDCFNDFKKFISRGNVVDLAVGIILGTAFTAIVTSLVKDIFTPIIALAGGGGNLEQLFHVLRYGNDEDKQNATQYATIAQAAAAGAVTLNWGRFVSTIINFFIVGFILFIIIKIVSLCMKWRKEPEAPSTDWPCPMCCEMVKEAALRCPHCTTDNIKKNN